MKIRLKNAAASLVVLMFIIFTKAQVVMAVQAAGDGGGGGGSPKNEALKLSVTYIDGYLKAFGALIVFAAVALIGIRMVILHNRTDDRADSMTAFLHIASGACIIGAALIIAGFLVNTQNNMLTSFSKGVESVSSDKEDKVSDDSDFITRALSTPINAIIDLVFGGDGKDGLQKLMGFKNIDKLIFNDGKVTGAEPFTSSEWNSLDYLYYMFIGITAPFILIMVGKTGFSAIKNSSSVSKRVGLKDDIGRWFISIFIIAAGPLFFRGMIYFFNLMSSAIYQSIIVPTSLNTSSLSIDATSIESLTTGNVFSTAIVKAVFCYVDVKINIVFLARKIMLSVMYVFTPIAAMLWGINKNVNAASMWFGELITNSAMAFFYGITYTIMCVMINASGVTGWFFTLMWMFSMMKIASVLRNSLQGLFARLSGINEEDMGKGASRVVGGAVAAVKATTKTAGSMAINGYAGTGSTANKDGNTNYSTMSGKGNDKFSGMSNDSFGKSQSRGGYSGSASYSPGSNSSSSGEAGTGVGSAYNNSSPQTNGGGSSGGSDSTGKLENSKVGNEQNYGAGGSNGSVASKASSPSSSSPGQGFVGNHSVNNMKNHQQASFDNLSAQSDAHSKYSDMLYKNYDREIIKNGQRSSSFGTGGNRVLDAVEGVNRMRNANVRSNAAGQAISSTVDRMVQDSKNKDSSLYKVNNRPITDREATQILFGKKNTDKNKDGFIRNARVNNINGAKQIIASTNPYINADSNFKWSN